MRERLHRILSTTAGLRRAIPTPPNVDPVEEHIDDLETAEGDGATYVLRDLGNSGLNDVISNPVIMRRHRWRVALSVFAGFDVEASTTELAELSQKAIDALEDQGNYDYALTGLILVEHLTTTEHVIRDERLSCNLDFATRYDHDVSNY